MAMFGERGFCQTVEPFKVMTRLRVCPKDEWPKWQEGPNSLETRESETSRCRRYYPQRH